MHVNNEVLDMSGYSPLFPEGVVTNKNTAALRQLSVIFGKRVNGRGRLATALSRALGTDEENAAHGSARILATSNVTYNNAGGVRPLEMNDDGLVEDTDAIVKALNLAKPRAVMRDRSGNGAGSRW